MRWSDVHRAQQLVTGVGAGPLVEPLTYDDIKAFLRLPSDDDAVLVTSYITQAREKVEEDAGIYCITQKRDVVFDDFPDDPIQVPFEPLTAVDSIKVTSVAGVQSTVAAAVYQVDLASSPPRVYPADNQYWPTDIRRMAGIVMRCSVGYGATGASVPETALHAMRYLIRIWWYAYRGTDVVMPLTSPPKWVGYDNAIGLLRTRGKL
jgi:uncharacterized phiE125 gp8 family phage protein